jgi:SAM-dependent methyltransferase
MNPPNQPAVPDDQLEPLIPVLGGHIFFQTLAAAVEFDLFSLLERQGALSGAEIAKQLGIAPKPARILLLGCTSLGLLQKDGDKYRNSQLSRRYLTSQAPGNLIAVVKWQQFINYRAMFHFHEALVKNRNVGLAEFRGTEPTLYERLAHEPHLEKIFQDAMEGISVQANAMLAASVDFSHVRHLVDVGGGNATNIMALARKYPTMRASVFDSPSVCEIARANIARAGLADRLNAVAGDCFHDAFPAGADCILFGHFFTIWSEEKNKRLLKKCFDALPPGGSVIIFNMMQRDDGTGPLTAALGSPYFLTLATGEGMLYTWKEYQTWMREAGFPRVTTQALPRDHGVVIGTKAGGR